ncbi:MAG: proton-conducting transporter membrane subunit [Candidatus Competibacteraceae bacterium]|nr:proton-conducting transporter membrane subunit [Candidatus Competibacteraceae bacterium]
MPQWFAFLPIGAPLVLLAVRLLARRESGLRPRRVLGAGQGATGLALALALVAVAAVAFYGPVTSPVIGLGDWGLSIRLDALSVTLFALVSFVGAIVVRFSRHYLDGDARQGVFVGNLCLTLAAVSLLVLAGNLLQLVLAWIGTSLALQRLLLFYADRTGAVLAARKKYLVARAGDGCLILAVLMLAWSFGSGDIATLLAQAREMAAGDQAIPLAVPFATLLLAVAALLKSAQFPTHGWLPEVVETPTPVSALLHAGIINAGGFLVVRFADVMLLSTSSLHLLALVGGFTALFGSVVMLTQSSVKVSLAYSTVAQMGFMFLQCGFGAFSVAVLHMVAHSLYKAHAFLSSGSVVELARASWVPGGEGRPHPLRVLAGLIAAVAILVGVGVLFGVTVQDKPALLALGAILMLGLTHLFAQAMESRPRGYVLGRIAGIAVAVALLYFTLQAGAATWLATTLPASPRPDTVTVALMILAVGSFALITLLQIIAPYRLDRPRWRAAYVWIANGLYANALFNRLLSTLERPLPSSNKEISL